MKFYFCNPRVVEIVFLQPCYKRQESNYESTVNLHTSKSSPLRFLPGHVLLQKYSVYIVHEVGDLQDVGAAVHEKYYTLNRPNPDVLN